ncbi:S1-like domain-containing RNA-binding protein, partial [Zeaxanthinibacter enoshimensis]
MIEIGNYNKLTILRSTSVGLFLGDEDVDDLLLPNKYVPEDYEIGDEIEVFCYLDHEERPVAT